MAGIFVSKENAADHAALRKVPSRAEGERADVAAFRQRLDLTHLIDVHTHFMPERVLAKVWSYFEEAGPLVGAAGRSPTASRSRSGWRSCGASASARSRR